MKLLLSSHFVFGCFSSLFPVLANCFGHRILRTIVVSFSFRSSVVIIL